MVYKCKKCGKEFEKHTAHNGHVAHCYGDMKNGRSEKTKEKISQTLEGHSYNTGWSHTKEAKQKISEVHKGRSMSASVKKKISESMKGFEHTEEAKQKIGKASKRRERKPHTEKTKKHLSKQLKEKWKQDDFKQKVFSGWQADKTNLEEEAESIIKELDLDFEFVGDFSYNIGTKCPDFINEEEKEVIEVYNVYLKKQNLDLDSISEYKEPRRQYFNERGWEVHFIPAKTLREDLEGLVNMKSNKNVS